MLIDDSFIRMEFKMQKKTDSGALVSLQKMARQLGVPVKWLRDQAAAGVIPGLRAGNRWLFCPEVAVAAVRALAGDAQAAFLVDHSLHNFRAAVQSGDRDTIAAARRELQENHGDDLKLIDARQSKGGDQ
jgi:hypothetical protein